MKSTDPRTFIWLSVISLALVVGFVLGGILGHRAVGALRTQQRSNLSALRAEQLHSCERDNVQRAQDNDSHLQDYNVFSFVVDRFSAPTKTETAAQKKITAQFAGTLHMAVAEKSWVPLTDCAVAVTAEGSSYAPPQPVPFSRGPAPASALDPQTAGSSSPPGSVP